MPSAPAQELMDSVLDVVSHGIIVLDANEKVVRWSGWLARVSGIDAAAAHGRRLDEIFPELTGNRVLGAVHSVLQQGFPSVISQSLNKAPFPLFAKTSPRSDVQRLQQKINVLPLKQQGVITGCVIEIVDVSLAVYRETVLSEQKEFLNAILESAPECVMVLASDGRVLQINRAGLAMLEVPSLDAVLAAGFIDFVLPVHRTQFEAMSAAVFAGTDQQLEFEIKGRSDKRCWIESNATPLRITAHATPALLLVGRDVTQRRQAEATTRALINATRDAAMLLDRDSGILAVNETAARTLGRAVSDLVGARYLTLLSPVVARETAIAIERVLDSGESVSLSQTYYGAQLDTVIYPVKDGANSVTSVAIYSADVTERMQQAAVDALFNEIDKRILRGHAKQALFDFICSEVARIFDFPVVWIGRKMPAGVLSVWARGAQDDAAAGYFSKLEAVGARWDNTPLGKGPAGNSIRFGQPQAAHVGDADFTPWRKAADAHQLRAFLSIPLILRGEVFGNFTLSSRLEDTFDNALTVRHLTDLASRICVVEERAMDHEQLRLLQTALSAAANGVFITDRNGRIEWLNAAFVTITGYSEAEALGATPRLLRIGKGDSSFFAEMLQSIAEGESWSGETSEQRKDGTQITLRQTITAIRDEGGEAQHFISILEDVTVTRAAEESVMRLAHYDYLTSLPNRALFNDRLHNAVARANRSKDVMALMFLDLDHFKSVNDTHGHDVGDLLLQQVAQRLQACVRASDTLARLAGDEFTVLLPAMAAREDVTVVAEKIVAAFATAFDLGRVTLESGVSIGIALFPDDATEAAPLLKHADTAMYAAKRSGRNGYAFYADSVSRTAAQ